MIFIAHRGNLDGANPNRENHPDYIQKAIDKGYSVEIDVWFENNKFCLGHDGPQYEVSNSFLENKLIWCHAKSHNAVNKLRQDKKTHYFWHQEDDYTITSNGYIWVYPGKVLISECIAVMPENKYANEELTICGGICSDIIALYKQMPILKGI